MKNKEYYSLDSDIFPLEFPVCQEPIVSIVIPVHNHCQHTFTCLKSILNNTHDIAYETIVVNNASTAPTCDMLAQIKHLQVLSCDTNLGFVEACNLGAQKARGKYIVFLNNDTIVLANWLAFLVQTCEDDSQVGAVGSKLIYPDGQLQEAGGIIYQDGSGCNFGNQDSPEKPEYCYVREVDYCSGSSLLVRSSLFKELGGFDTRFSPGYYEDTDLCFSLRANGYKVMYQPRSEVVHFEGASAGTDLSQGMKRYQNINKSKFVEKWQSHLQHQPQPIEDPYLSSTRVHGKVILVVSRFVPRYDQDSGSLRIYSILKILSKLGHKVVFIPYDLYPSGPYTQELQQAGIEVHYSASSNSAHRFEEYLHQFLQNYSAKIGVAIFCYMPIADKSLSIFRQHNRTAKIIFDTVDLHYLRHERHGKLYNDSLILEQARMYKDIELNLCAKSNNTWVVSPIEKDILHNENKTIKIDIVPNIHETIRKASSFEGRKNLLFIGSMDHFPNEDALLYFIQDIFPLIKQKIPEIVFTIIGPHASEKLQSFSCATIRLTGHVKDVAPYFQEAKVFVCPLRFGAGLKGKIGQSMSYGLPVVTTDMGAEGFGLEHKKTALIANNSEVFATLVVELYTNALLWTKLSKNGIKIIKNQYSPIVVQNHIKNIVNSLL